MLKTLSWVVLGLVATATLVFSLLSVRLAYAGDPARDVFGQGGPSVKDISAWRVDVGTGVRARRGTAAAYATAYAVLMLTIVLVPYRRGEVWAWWALLGSAAMLAVLMWLRVPMLGTRLGASTGSVQLGATALGLLLDAGRVRGKAGAAPASA